MDSTRKVTFDTFLHSTIRIHRKSVIFAIILKAKSGIKVHALIPFFTIIIGGKDDVLQIKHLDFVLSITGVMLGLFAQCHQEVINGYVDIDWFEYK